MDEDSMLNTMMDTDSDEETLSRVDGEPNKDDSTTPPESGYDTGLLDSVPASNSVDASSRQPSCTQTSSTQPPSTQTLSTQPSSTQTLSTQSSSRQSSTLGHRSDTRSQSIEDNVKVLLQREGGVKELHESIKWIVAELLAKNFSRRQYVKKSLNKGTQEAVLVQVFTDRHGTLVESALKLLHYLEETSHRGSEPTDEQKQAIKKHADEVEQALTLTERKKFNNSKGEWKKTIDKTTKKPVYIAARELKCSLLQLLETKGCIAGEGTKDLYLVLKNRKPPKNQPELFKTLETVQSLYFILEYRVSGSVEDRLLKVNEALNQIPSTMRFQTFPKNRIQQWKKFVEQPRRSNTELPSNSIRLMEGILAQIIVSDFDVNLKQLGDEAKRAKLLDEAFDIDNFKTITYYRNDMQHSSMKNRTRNSNITLRQYLEAVRLTSNHLRVKCARQGSGAHKRWRKHIKGCIENTDPNQARSGYWTLNGNGNEIDLELARATTPLFGAWRDITGTLHNLSQKENPHPKLMDCIPHAMEHHRSQADLLKSQVESRAKQVCSMQNERTMSANGNRQDDGSNEDDDDDDDDSGDGFYTADDDSDDDDDSHFGGGGGTAGHGEHNAGAEGGGHVCESLASEKSAQNNSNGNREHCGASTATKPVSHSVRHELVSSSKLENIASSHQAGTENVMHFSTEIRAPDPSALENYLDAKKIFSVEESGDPKDLLMATKVKTDLPAHVVALTQVHPFDEDRHVSVAHKKQPAAGIDDPHHTRDDLTASQGQNLAYQLRGLADKVEWLTTAQRVPFATTIAVPVTDTCKPVTTEPVTEGCCEPVEDMIGPCQSNLAKSSDEVKDGDDGTQRVLQLSVKTTPPDLSTAAGQRDVGRMCSIEAISNLKYTFGAHRGVKTGIGFSVDAISQPIGLFKKREESKLHQAKELQPDEGQTESDTCIYKGSRTESTQPEKTLPIVVSDDDFESDISDIEGTDYCDSSKPDNIEMNMSLTEVTHPRIKQLYYQDEKVYKMSHQIRGRVLIINNRRFKDLPERTGSEVDYLNISRLFKALGFDIAKTQEELTDLTDEEMCAEIREETSRPEHYSYGMFVLVVMSYGMARDVILDTNGKPIPLIMLQDLLSPHNFQAMKGKPKLVIVQACSGDRTDFGDSDDVSEHYHPSDPTATRPVGSPNTVAQDMIVPSTSTATVSEPLPLGFHHRTSVFRRKPPSVFNAEDLLIMKASSESCLAVRSPTHGSWFIRVLVATFYKHSCHRDVETLFKIVQHRIRRVSMFDRGGRTFGYMGGNVPESRCTFTNYRKLYLFPGYPF